MFGSLEITDVLKDGGIQPIMGCLLTINTGWGGEVFDMHQLSAAYDKIPLIAKDEQGYANLLKLTSAAFLHSEDPHNPVVDLGVLSRYSEGIIALTGGVDGPIGRLLVAGAKDEAKTGLERLLAMFGDRLYIELQRHGLIEQEKIEETLLDFAYDLNIPLVATNDVHFAKRNMYEAHDALLCISEGRYLSEEDRRKLTTEHYFKSPTEMKKLFRDLPEAIENTIAIAKRCACLLYTSDAADES